MSTDADIAALLDDVLAGNDPDMERLDKPKAPDTEPLSKDFSEKEVSEISIEDIIGDVVDDPDLHACKEPEEEDPEIKRLFGEGGDEAVETPEPSDEYLAELPEVDETKWSTEVEVVEPTIPMPEFTSEEMMDEIDIRKFGTLVSLNTQRWHAKTRDHKAAADAASASGADKSAFEARKRLLVGADEKLKRVHKAIDSARTDHYQMTLPWSTIGVNDHGKRAGARLLPNTLFFDYTQKMAAHKMAMDKALGEFVQAYPSLIAIAQQKLGSSFNFAEYPRPSAIGMHFNLSFDFIPIPVGQDFNGVGLQQAEKLAMAVNKKTKTMLENAMQDVWKRLSNDLEHAYNTLSNPNLGFHSTLIEKIRSHATMLSHLNVTKDDRIEELRNLIGKKLCRWDAKDIKKDDALRKRLAGTAAEVIEKMKEYCNA